MVFTPYFFESITITIESQIILIETQTLLQCDFCCIFLKYSSLLMQTSFHEYIRIICIEFFLKNFFLYQQFCKRTIAFITEKTEFVLLTFYLL